ncbi:MAG: putative glycoside hydrolase [Terriglobales bacterium]
MRRLGPLNTSVLLGIVVILAIAVAVAVLPWPKTASAQPRESSSADKATSKTAAKPSTPEVAAPGTVLYPVQKGDSTHTLLRKFWPQSSYMTTAEFLAALRAANTGKISGDWPKPGVTLVIPGMEGPVVEKPVPMAKEAEVRAIYLTHIMAGSHNGLELIKRWKAAGGNAVVFDVKDSDGSVGIPFDNPFNPNTSRPDIPNLPKFVRWMHRQNLHVIARIACFRDERLVTAHPELAVKSRSSSAPWRENGKLVWTDPSDLRVQDYDIALAMKAIEGGVDEIQFDYVRFPAEGNQPDAKFEFQSSHPDWQRSDVIANFLSRAYAKIHPAGDLLSLDVFGVMAWQRSVDLSHTGQDISKMAKNCDILSPMIYPSHFFGMDGYAVPGDAPEHFIGESMDRFQKVTAESGVVLRPWLQAFHWRTPSYSPTYIETQVAVAKAHSGDGFLFWNAANDYSKPFVAMPVMMANPDKYFGRAKPAPSPTPAAATPVKTAGM